MTQARSSTGSLFSVMLLAVALTLVILPSLAPSLYVVPASALLGGFLGAFFTGYLTERGKQHAIEDGFEKLLQQQKRTADAVETVKASISGELWVAQERWKLKRDTYVALVQTLNSIAGEAASLLRDLKPIKERPGPVSKEEEQEILNLVTPTYERVRVLRTELESRTAMAMLWLERPQALQALLALHREVWKDKKVEGHWYGHVLTTVSQARSELWKAARIELGLAQRDIGPHIEMALPPQHEDSSGT